MAGLVGRTESGLFSDKKKEVRMNDKVSSNEIEWRGEVPRGGRGGGR